jgi:hypothetical protein
VAVREAGRGVVGTRVRSAPRDFLRRRLVTRNLLISVPSGVNIVCCQKIWENALRRQGRMHCHGLSRGMALYRIVAKPIGAEPPSTFPDCTRPGAD